MTPQARHALDQAKKQARRIATSKNKKRSVRTWARWMREVLK